MRILVYKISRSFVSSLILFFAFLAWKDTNRFLYVDESLPGIAYVFFVMSIIFSLIPYWIVTGGNVLVLKNEKLEITIRYTESQVNIVTFISVIYPGVFVVANLALGIPFVPYMVILFPAVASLVVLSFAKNNRVVYDLSVKTIVSMSKTNFFKVKIIFDDDDVVGFESMMNEYQINDMFNAILGHKV